MSSHKEDLALHHSVLATNITGIDPSAQTLAQSHEVTLIQGPAKRSSRSAPYKPTTSSVVVHTAHMDVVRLRWVHLWVYQALGCQPQTPKQ